MRGFLRGRNALRLIGAMVTVFFYGAMPGAFAQTVNKFALPAANSDPQVITTGPDGALWFTEQGANKIGRITTAGAITEYPIPTAGSLVVGITTGPDGNLWFAESAAPGDTFNGGMTNAPGKIGRITTSGTITEFTVPTPSSRTNFIVTGPDGNLWFTELSGNNIGQITPSGAITEFPIPTASSRTIGIAVGPDGALWFAEMNAGKIGRITTSGAFTEFPLPSGAQPVTITLGPDGNLWFDDFSGSGKVGKMTTSGTVTEYAVPTANSQPIGPFTGPDGALWFVESNAKNVGRITTSGTVTEYQVSSNSAGLGQGGIAPGPDGAMWFVQANESKIARITTSANATSVTLVSAILPSSRSVQVGNTATAFATMINTDTATATSCGLVPTSSVPATFSFQTTDPNTNALTGTVNTAVSIPAGKSQSFVIAFTPSGAFAPTNVALGFACANENAASVTAGVNTLLLSGSATPVPDVVALVASGDPGIVDIPGATGTGAFAVASVNVGSSSSITVSADTGATTLPVTVTLCQTNPTSGACITPVQPSVTTTINAGNTPTFGIFVAGSSTVSFSPGANRIFVRFKDAGSVTRGSTSVAVRTQ